LIVVDVPRRPAWVSVVLLDHEEVTSRIGCRDLYGERHHAEHLPFALEAILTRAYFHAASYGGTHTVLHSLPAPTRRWPQPAVAPTRDTDRLDRRVPLTYGPSAPRTH